MAQLTATALAMVDATPEQVRAAIADYEAIRPTMLTSHFSGYQVLAGGQGAGSQVGWTLSPSRWRKKRARDWVVDVEVLDDQLVERDLRSSMVTTWTVTPAGNGRSAVRVHAVWEGPDGFRGVLARSRSARIRKIYGEMLFKLRKHFAPPEDDEDDEP